MNDDFVIDQVSWHTETVGNTETVDHIHARFRSLINFLQENGLTTRMILKSEEPVADELAIKVSDLTERGFLLIKKCYDKWLKALDKGKAVSDIKIFEKELRNMR